MGVIQKRGESYRVLIRKAGMPAISKTFPKKALAQAWMTETEANIAKGNYREDQMNFGRCVDKYIDEYGPFGDTKQGVLRLVQRNLGHHSLKDLKSSTLISYANVRAKTAQASTVQQDMIYVGVVLKAAEAAWDCKPKIDEYEKAMHFLKSKQVIAESNERERRVTDSEIDLILQHADTRLPLADLIRFSVLTAMRRGEVLSMTWDELGDEGRSIGLWRKHPEGKRYSRVPLLQEAADIIQRQPRTDARIFPYNPETVSAAFQRSRNRIGLDVRWHDLRHEGCSRLFELGLDAMTVALFSGHRDINMLRRYTHLNATQVLERLGSQ